MAVKRVPKAAPGPRKRRRAEAKRAFVRSANQATTTALGTQDDTPAKLLEDLVKGRLDARDLTGPQRKAILLLKAGGKHTSAELAVLLKVSPKQIRKDRADIRREIGREVKEWTLEEVAGGMILAAEKYQAKAAGEGDLALAWSIERDKVKLLKEMGLLGQREHTGGVRLTLEVMGQGYERTREALGRALDPMLTGQVIDVEPKEVEEIPTGPSLDLPRGLPGPPPTVEHQGAPEPVEVVERDPAIEEALAREVEAALEGESLSPAAGPDLEALRRAHGHPQA